MAIQNPEIFHDKKFQDILEDIYNNSKEKRKQITILMNTLSDMIKKPVDAAVIAPLVKEFFEVAVKNDEHLVKMAAIVQRLISADSQSGGNSLESILTAEEKNDLLREIEKESEQKGLVELGLILEREEKIGQLTQKSMKIINSKKDKDVDGPPKNKK